MTLERFKNGFSCIPGSSMEVIAEDFGMTRGNIMFRDFSDAIATQVWNHPWRLELVMAVWSHCFSFTYEQIKKYEKENTQNRTLHQERK